MKEETNEDAYLHHPWDNIHESGGGKYENSHYGYGLNRLNKTRVTDFLIRKIMKYTRKYCNSVRMVKRATSLASVSRLDLVRPVRSVCHLNDSNRYI